MLANMVITMETLAQGLLREIVEAGKQKRLNQGELCKLAGISASTVSKIKSGVDVQLSTLERLAQVAGLRVCLKNAEPLVEQLSRGTLFDFGPK